MLERTPPQIIYSDRIKTRPVTQSSMSPTCISGATTIWLLANNMPMRVRLSHPYFEQLFLDIIQNFICNLNVIHCMNIIQQSME